MPQIPSRRIRLTFDEVPGLEIYMGSMSVAEALAFDENSVDDRFAKFADLLHSWNVEDEQGRPVPATIDGIRSIEISFAYKIMQAWTDALTGVPGPLDRPSTDGLPWEGAPIPTEAL